MKAEFASDGLAEGECVVEGARDHAECHSDD